MRKVLSFVLVLSLVLGSFGMAFAATTPSKTALSDISGKDCEDAVRVLTELDVVSGYADGTYKPDATVTRAEMASLVIKGLGLKETNAVPKFADSRNHWAKGYIAYANTLGIISGRTATTFDPDATVTYDEATTMLIKALGYTDEALVGTYPASFVSRARVLGILDNVKTGSGAANRGDVAVMLYQTIDQAIGKVDKDGNFQSTVTKYDKDGKAKEYDTMLARLGAEVASKDTLSGVADWRPDVDENAFVVSGDEDTLININPYKGAVVSAYINSDDDIIAIKEVFTTFVTGSFGDAKFDTDTIFTLADGTEYTMKQDAIDSIKKGDVNAGTAIPFVNGDQKKLTEKLQNGGTGSKAVYTMAVELSGKKINDIHSVLKWEATDDAKVKSEDVTAINSSKKLLGVKFAQNDNGDIDQDSFDLVGVKSLDDIKADNIVYVYKNGDSEISRVAVGTEAPSGVVSKLNAGESKVTIDGKTYKYASVELAGNKVEGAIATGKIDTDDEVMLYLDAYGYIYDKKQVSGTADKFAIVLTAGKTAGLKGDDPQVELLLADGTTKIFDINKDVKDKSPLLIDPNGKWQADAMKYVTKGAIVKYGLNKSGEITSLFAATSTSAIAAGNNNAQIGTVEDEDLAFYADLTGGNNISSKGYFDGKQIATDAVIFDYDGAGFTTPGALSDDDDDYNVVKYESVLDSDDVKAYYVYDTDSKEIISMLLDGAGSSSNVFGVVVGNGKNNSDAGAYFNMLIDGKEVSYNGDDTLVLKSDRMDLVNVKFDGNGDVDVFNAWNSTTDKVQYVSTGALTENMSAKAYSDNTFKFEKATVLQKNNGTKGNVTTSAIAKGQMITLDRDVVVYTFDRIDEEWQIGSKSDLNDLRNGDWAKFYDVDDEDGVFDVVLVNQGASGRVDADDEPAVGDVTISDSTKSNAIDVTEISNASDVAMVTLGDKELVKDTDYTATYGKLTLKPAGIAKVQEADKDVTVKLVIEFASKGSRSISVTIKSSASQAEAAAKAAVGAVTKIVFVPNATDAVVAIDEPATHANGATYAWTASATDPASLTSGGAVTTSGTAIKITRENADGVNFSFDLTLTATSTILSQTKTATKVFTVTVPTTGAITAVVK